MTAVRLPNRRDVRPDVITSARRKAAWQLRGKKKRPRRGEHQDRVESSLPHAWR
jgi:hypothetical protein